MLSVKTRFRRRLKAVQRKSRELLMIAKGLASTDHPVQAQLIPMRRCNLSCTYCSEYDDFPDPVPLEEMYRRFDKLAQLAPTLIGIIGGEPLLNPKLDDFFSPIRPHGMICALIPNG